MYISIDRRDISIVFLRHIWRLIYEKLPSEPVSPRKTQLGLMLPAATDVYFNRSKRYFYCIFTTHMTFNLWEKQFRQKYGLFMQNKCLYRISSFYEKRINTHNSWRLNNSSKTFLNQWESMGFRKLHCIF